MTAQRKDLERLLRELLYPVLPEIMAQAERDRAGVRVDAARDVLAGIFAEIGLELERLYPQGQLEQELLSISTASDELHAAQFDKQIQAPLQVAIVQPAAWRQPVIQGFIKDNVSLVRRLSPGGYEDLETIVSGGIRQGLRVETIRAQIEAKLGVTKSRASLIARDQVGKLYGEMTQHRQQAVGIATYIWSTSLDERVRPRHAELEGTKQKWSDPPIVDSRTGRRAHPGGDYQCRCQAIPDIPEEWLT